MANVEAEDAVTVEGVEEDGEEVLLQARLLPNQKIQLEECYTEISVIALKAGERINLYCSL